MRTNKIKGSEKSRVIFICAITLIIIILVITSIFSVCNEIMKKSEEKKFYSNELERLKEEEEYLKVEVEKLQDPDYIARYAREQYLYSKDGEFNIRMP